MQVTTQSILNKTCPYFYLILLKIYKISRSITFVLDRWICVASKLRFLRMPKFFLKVCCEKIVSGIKSKITASARSSKINSFLAAGSSYLPKILVELCRQNGDKSMFNIRLQMKAITKYVNITVTLKE